MPRAHLFQKLVLSTRGLHERGRAGFGVLLGIWGRIIWFLTPSAPNPPLLQPGVRARSCGPGRGSCRVTLDKQVLCLLTPSRAEVAAEKSLRGGGSPKALPRRGPYSVPRVRICSTVWARQRNAVVLEMKQISLLFLPGGAFWQVT